MLLALLDQAVEWLLARGQAGQWGTGRPSQRTDWQARVHELATNSTLRLLELNGQVVGVLAVGAAPAHVEAIAERELYIELVLTSRSHAGKGLGTELIALAEETARERAASILRVDCWAEAPALIGWYESQGFTRSGTFAVRGWPGQILSRRLSDAAPRRA